MAKKRISMRKIKEVLRLRFEVGLSYDVIGQSCNIGHTTVGEYLRRAKDAGLTWPLPEDMDDASLEKLLYSRSPDVIVKRPMPDWEYVHKELKRKSVTLFLLWQEYKETYPDGYEYSWFCRNYKEWSGKIDVAMRFNHRAGEKLFVDYAGYTIPIIDKRTGQIREAQIFVATLGASNYTYAEATWTQSLADWIGSHTRALKFLGGVPEIIVPDNLKVGVDRSCRYEPDLNPTYQDMASHYRCAVIPTRIRSPKDKAKVETAVKTVEQWILARLRNIPFFTLTDLNKTIRNLLEDINSRAFQKMGGTRRSMFEELDRPALKPLPVEPYAYAEWKKTKPHIDYHMEVKGFYYSAPYQLAKKEMDVRITQHTIEIFYSGKRVASHQRSYDPSKRFITLREHMPKSHQKYLDWTPDRIIRWASKTGTATAQITKIIMENRSHPQQGFRSCMGIMSLGKEYGQERLEAACSRALTIGSPSYKSIQAILKKGLDRVPPQKEAPQQTSFITHSNIRGPQYYQITKGENNHVDSPDH
jgi:transposase